MKMSLRLTTLLGFVAPAYRAAPDNALLLCLCTNVVPSAYACPMPLEPEPATGFLIDEDFATYYAAALNANSAIHDGAVMACRSDDSYAVRGWSFRLFPPAIAERGEVNRGTAFHSCLAMSAVMGVDGLILCSGRQGIVFCNGAVASRTSL